MHEVEYRQVGAYISNVTPDAEATRGYISGILVFGGIFVYQWDFIVQSSGENIPFTPFWEFLVP